MKTINWPSMFLPGTTDNFVSNEKIVTGLPLNNCGKSWSIVVSGKTIMIMPIILSC